MLPYDVGKEAGFHVNTNDSNSMEAANGSAIDILGSCTFQATFPETGKSTEIMALVAKDTRDILISWHDLIDLGWELKHQIRALQSNESASQNAMSKIFI